MSRNFIDGNEIRIYSKKAARSVKIIAHDMLVAKIDEDGNICGLDDVAVFLIWKNNTFVTECEVGTSGDDVFPIYEEVNYSVRDSENDITETDITLINLINLGRTS